MFNSYRRRIDEETLVQVLDQLAESGYQSDERFAESFVRSRIQRGQGPVRIAAELKQRGCSRSLIDDYVLQADHDWPVLAREALRKRFGFYQDGDERPVLGPKAFGKAGRFLASRGFPVALINQLVERTYDDGVESPDDELDDPECG